MEHSNSFPPSLSLPILSNIQFQQGMFYNAIAIIFYPLCGGRWGLFSKRRWLHFAFSSQRKNMFLHTRIPGDFGEINFFVKFIPQCKVLGFWGHLFFFFLNLFLLSCNEFYDQVPFSFTPNKDLTQFNWDWEWGSWKFKTNSVMCLSHIEKEEWRGSGRSSIKEG